MGSLVRVSYEMAFLINSIKSIVIESARDVLIVHKVHPLSDAIFNAMSKQDQAFIVA